MNKFVVNLFMNDLRKEIGNYLLDISKLVFGGAVLASVLKIEDFNKLWILLSGTIVTLVLAFGGFLLIKK